MDEHDNKTGSQKQGGWTPGQVLRDYGEPVALEAAECRFSLLDRRDGVPIAFVYREEDAALYVAAPDLYAAAQKLMQSIQEMDPEQRGCSTVAYAEMWEALERANPSTDQGEG